MSKIGRKPTIVISLLLAISLIVSIIMFYCNNMAGEMSYLKTNPDIYAKISYFSFWWFLITFDIFAFIFYLSPIFIPIMTCYAFYEIYHSGYLTNIVQRDKYDNVLKKQIFKCWIKNLIIPLILIIFFIICMFIFPNGNVKPISFGETFVVANEYMGIINPYLFVVLHMLLLFLYGIFITNISLILNKYIKKFSLLVIAVFIIVMIIENYGNLILGPLVRNITGITRIANGFSVLNLLYLDGIPSLWWEFLWIIILNILTIIFIIKIYSNKEKVLNNYD